MMYICRVPFSHFYSLKSAGLYIIDKGLNPDNV
jgi:hypothetical protein